MILLHLKRADETIQKLNKANRIKTSMSIESTCASYGTHTCNIIKTFHLCKALDLGHVSSVASEVSEAMAEVAF